MYVYVCASARRRGSLPAVANHTAVCQLLGYPLPDMRRGTDTMSVTSALGRYNAPQLSWMHGTRCRRRLRGWASSFSFVKRRKVIANAQGIKLGDLVVPAVLCSSLLFGDPGLALQNDVASNMNRYMTDAFAADTAFPPIPTEFPPLPELALPSYHERTLDNGLRIFLLEDHELPFVSGTLLIRGGQLSAPADKASPAVSVQAGVLVQLPVASTSWNVVAQVGLPTLAAKVQRLGGSEQHPAGALDDRLDELQAALDAGSGQQALYFDFECMREDVSEVVGLMEELIRQPVLPQDKINLYKDQMQNLIEHRFDNTSAVASRELLRLIYGKGSIYARQATAEIIDSISREDIHTYISYWERPDAAVLGITGDFHIPSMTALLDRELGSWQPSPGTAQQERALPKEELELDQRPEQVFLVDSPDMKQLLFTGECCCWRAGAFSSHPDAYALDVLGQIFNSFGGRLFDEIRSKDGLAYSVGGGWNMPPDHPGFFQIRSDTVAPAELLNILREKLHDATKSPPSEEELRNAKAEAANSFVFNFASPLAQMQRIILYDLLGLPQDYLFKYKQGIERVSAQDILLAAQRHLHPNNQSAVIVADAKSVSETLMKAGIHAVRLQPE